MSSPVLCAICAPQTQVKPIIIRVLTRTYIQSHARLIMAHSLRKMMSFDEILDLTAVVLLNVTCWMKNVGKMFPERPKSGRMMGLSDVCEKATSSIHTSAAAAAAAAAVWKEACHAARARAVQPVVVTRVDGYGSESSQGSYLGNSDWLRPTQARMLYLLLNQRIKGHS